MLQPQPGHRPIPQRPTDDRLRHRPSADPTRERGQRAPDGRDRTEVARITREIHNTTIINNNAYIQNSVFPNRGWQHDSSRGIYYYHHPTYYGLIGVYFGSAWYWTQYHNDAWWWYHPHHRRWLVRRGDQWWYYHDAYGWTVWYEDRDAFYVVRDDSIAREAPPTQPPPTQPAPPATPPEEERETVYYSEDGSLVVYVLGEKAMAHLYTNPDLQHVAYLGDGVKSVRFTTDRNNENAPVILVEFSDGQIALFDRNGDIYGDPGEGTEEPGSEEPGETPPPQGVTDAVQTAPSDIPRPEGLPEAPPAPKGGPVPTRRGSPQASSR